MKTADFVFIVQSRLIIQFRQFLIVQNIMILKYKSIILPIVVHHRSTSLHKITIVPISKSRKTLPADNCLQVADSCPRTVSGFFILDGADSVIQKCNTNDLSYQTLSYKPWCTNMLHYLLIKLL